MASGTGTRSGINTGATERTVTVTGLTPCTEYTLSVAGMSGDGTVGQFGDGKSQMTDGEGKPLHKVNRFALETKNKNSTPNIPVSNICLVLQKCCLLKTVLIFKTTNHLHN